MNQLKLNNPPILDAVIGVSIENNEYWQQYYSEVVDLIKNDYAVVNERVAFRVKGKFSPVAESNEAENSQETQILKDGYALSNPESRKFILLKPDSIQITKRVPYVSWEDLYDEFVKVTRALKDVAPSLVFSKPYLKYRNRFGIYFTEEPLEDYFTVSHRVPLMMTQVTISNLTFSVDMSEEVFDYKVEQNIKPSGKADNLVNVSISIEVGDKGIKTLDIHELYSCLDGLREKKNKIFFSLITDKAKQLFV